jgi:hypothetical protein
MRLPLVISVTALAVAVLGSTPVGEAAKGLVVPRNSVGTAQIKPNSVTSAKIKDLSLLAADFKSGQIPAGPVGPAGPAGPPGQKGDKGDSATRSWATVNRDGSVARQSGGITVTKAGTGFYGVTFDRDVSGCALLASAQAGYALIGQVPPRRTIFINIYIGTTAVDSLFYIGAFC